MKKIALAFAATLIVAAAVPAQTSAPVSPVASYSTGPWQQDAVLGVQNKTANFDYSSRAAYSAGANKGQPIALMAVGGAAIILGALMDNNASGLLIVGGSVIGLYGLYLYLR